MILFTKTLHLRKFLAQKTAKGNTVGFVPTMGALHNGHLQLLHTANAENDVSVCSIFVNPTQFNNKEDLEKYPRLVEKDILLLAQNGCDVLFYPAVHEMYAYNEPLLQVDLKGIDRRLEGEHRPGHFTGVATIVKKLLDAVQPHRAYFGQKDYQQVRVVQTMVQQLNMPVQIVPVPTVREAGGLAMSSRNLRLGDNEKEAATVIYRALLWAKEQYTQLPSQEIITTAEQMIREVTGTEIEYFELADADTLEPITTYNPGKKIVALTAVNLGGVRLIDNMEL